MNKKKKKTNAFRKSIPLVVFTILGMFLVSSALVGYLSNTVEANVEIKSPISLEIDNENLGSIHGTESVSFTVTETIHVAEIDSNLVITISEKDGKIDSCDEITSLTLDKVETSQFYDITLLCEKVEVDGESVLEFDGGVETYVEGVRNYIVEVTFAPNALGNYTGKAQHLLPA